VEKACVYELVLISGKVDYTVEEGIINQSVAATIPTDSIEEKKSFVVVESMPSFPGGNPALFKYLSENIKYPKKAMKKGIQGRVICQFIVNRDGSIVDVQVVRGVHELLDAEAVRVISNMPRWTPGRQRGKVVRVKYTLPVNFGLRKKSSTSN
jgi:TonB family protein